eukprot:TRINITY_DN31265_c0_g1_i1.p1 TRINITY_DN31265_c0_g1~~TRINITY_DN31265_c0_g1_i1.p1  ORF type:complete len:155 (+),score=10.94 TRINITY_DN31265_c0_g1_i1:71-535(+)
MPLPARRPCGSLMDTYGEDFTDMSCSSSSLSSASVMSAGSVTSQEVVKEYIRLKHEEEGPLRSGSGRSRGTAGTKTSSSWAHEPLEGVFRSGFFCSDFSARSKSSSCVHFPQRKTKFSPPGVEDTLRSRKEVTTPGPGSYTPVYSVLSRVSPFA